MNTVPSSTFFSAPPDWGWLIVFYFFFGGLAGGCYFLAVLIDLFGRDEDRPLARLGY
jgi:protein NrfD